MQTDSISGWPPEWETRPLGDVVDVLDSLRKPLNSEERATMKGRVPYYGANGVVDYIDRWIFDEPLLLIAEDGGYFEEFRHRPIAYLVEGKCWVNNHAHVLRVRGQHRRDWIFYSLVHRNLGPFINSGTRSKLNQGDLVRIPVPLPPLPEQKKIAEILGSVDEAIKATEAVIAQTRRVKEGLLQELLTKGIGHTKFKQTEIGEIPEGWDALDSKAAGVRILDGDRGKAYPKESDFLPSGYCLFLSAKNVTKRGLDMTDCAFISRERDEALGKGTVEPEDIVITTRGTIGNIGFFPTQLPHPKVRINSGMAIMRAGASRILPALLGQLLCSPVVVRQVERLTFGSAQPQLTLGILRSLVLPVPPKEEQAALLEVLRDQDDCIATGRSEAEQLRTVKHGLLQDLLTGKVRVQP